MASLLFCHCPRADEPLHLQLRVTPQFSSKTIAFSELSLTNSFGQIFSITRLDFLLSNFALRNQAGEWIEQPEWYSFLSLAEACANVSVKQIPAGEYDRIRFKVGLLPAVNHHDPAQYGPQHPLNPNLNNLHWSWANGYIFFALEGHWISDKKSAGFSYHLGHDWMLAEVELPLRTIINASCQLELLLRLENFFDFEFAEECSSTHSRPGDEFALRLRENVKRSFALGRSFSAVENILPLKTSASFVPGISANKYKTTPYRFTFSAQFPMPDLPRDNPLTEEGVELGRLLFFEKKLSINDSQSCAACHEPTRAFTDSPRRVSIGAEGKSGARNSMPLFNLAWKKNFFWDGRARTLREQVLQPIENPVEMHETLPRVVAKLQKSTLYLSQFEKAFGSREITAERLARALEQFLLTQLSFDSKFDRATEGKAELTEEEKRGFELFITEYDPRREQFGADCFHCHGGPLFQSQSFANNGLDSLFHDSGRYEATKNEIDRGKFAVPSLRNVALTPPYMHDGRFKTLEEVVEHYASGIIRSPTLDPNLAKHPDGGVPLSAADQKALVAFLKTLTDKRWEMDTATDP